MFELQYYIPSFALSEFYHLMRDRSGLTFLYEATPSGMSAIQVLVHDNATLVSGLALAFNEGRTLVLEVQQDTSAPTVTPTFSPTSGPTELPTIVPTIAPTNDPTTASPSISPTSDPTFSPLFLGSTVTTNTASIDYLRSALPGLGSTNLCYRASENNFDVGTFHTLCDGRGPSVTLVRDINGNVFGGYNSISWESSGGHTYHADGSMLFLLEGPSVAPISAVSGSGQKAQQYTGDTCWTRDLYFSSSHGPYFGCADLRIYSNCNSNTQSDTRGNGVYAIDSGLASPAIFANYETYGETHFQCRDWEVWLIS